MDFFKIILPQSSSSEGVLSSTVNASELTSRLEEGGVALVYGNGQEMARFYRSTLPALQSVRSVLVRKFFVTSGDAKDFHTALPLDSKDSLSAALKALSLSRYDSRRVRSTLLMLRALALSVFRAHPYLFRKQFCLIFDERTGSFLSVLARGARVASSDLAFSIYQGSGKFILPLFRIASGEGTGYAKIYISKDKSEYYGKVEADALRFLEKFDFQTAEPPRLLSSEYFGENLVNIVSSKDGLKSFPRLSDQHVAWVKELWEKTGARKNFNGSYFARIIGEEMEFVKKKVKSQDFSAIEGLYQGAIKTLSGKEFLFSLVNREFDYYELLLHPRKNLVIDWEHSRNDFPPLFDVYSLLLSGELRRWNIDYVKKHVPNFEAFLSRRKKNDREMISSLLDSLNISKEDAYQFLLLFLVDRLYMFTYNDANDGYELYPLVG